MYVCLSKRRVDICSFYYLCLPSPDTFNDRRENIVIFIRQFSQFLFSHNVTNHHSFDACTNFIGNSYNTWSTIVCHRNTFIVHVICSQLLFLAFTQILRFQPLNSCSMRYWSTTRLTTERQWHTFRWITIFAVASRRMQKSERER